MQWKSPSWWFPFVFSLVAAVLPAQTATPNSSNRGAAPVAHERTVLTETFAQEKLWYWQQRLNLQEWNITLQVSRATELKPKTLGNIHWDRDKKTAVIRVLDPADYRLPFHAMLDDVEFTVVHELIHLELVPVLADLQRNEANRLEEEHAVNHVAEALLKLQRGK